ncbi:MAG: glycosyl transferase family 2 [Candidatus Omnitrophica bacterium CG11_big_fil_rev_8_21_14_0_20_63_9]|nr:MAG: glycosyl transferase family 2 [Candidatus Omnitrophica bacterium CG11_big_fil_rev_8_21_14_0_20_63_9]
MDSRYCVIIPAFQVAKTIGELVRAVKHQGLTVVVIDDGSHDTTAAVAAAHGALVISHLRNQGKGRALRTGFEYALRSQFDGVVTLDADGQHDPAEITRLIRAGEQQHAGIVVGNRMSNGAQMPTSRRATNQLMSRIVSAVARQPIPDTQSGFRVIRKEVLQDVSLRATRFDLETELLLAAAIKRWKIVSVPIQAIYGSHGSHIQPVRETVRFLGVILRYLLRPRR